MFGSACEGLVGSRPAHSQHPPTSQNLTPSALRNIRHARRGTNIFCLLILSPRFFLLIYQVRFLDTPLLPASSPEDYPKIIKSGIDEEGQHHKSPKITGPSGIATLLHKIGRPQLLERLFDTEGTEEYDLRVFMNWKSFSDIYVQRRGRNVEVSNIITARD